MKTKVSPTLVGIFVLGALMLAIIAVMSFGGVNFFSKPQRFISYFDESIHGLDLGSPVKLRGVRVGRVVDLNVIFNDTTNQSLVAVVCEFSRNIIVDGKGGIFDVSDRKRLQSMVDHGLRAELGVQGLATGMLFVELDFQDPNEYTSRAGPPGNSTLDKGYIVVPSMPSAISALQANFTQVMGEVKNMNLPELAKEMNGLIKDARKQLATLNLAEMSNEITRAGKSVSALAESAEVRQTFIDLSSAVTELRRTLAKLDKTIDPVGDKLTITLAEAQASLKKIGEAADSAKRFVNSNDGLGDSAAQAFRQVNDAAASLQRLLDYLERNPNALITGKKQP